jgi:hypothetical protein
MPLEPRRIAELPRVLDHAIQPRRERSPKAVTEVERAPPMLEGAAFERECARRHPLRFFRHAIDDAAAAPAAEHHRVRPLQCLHALDVIEIAQILGVIAYAVGEEIRGGAGAPNGRCIAVPLALPHRDPRHVADDIGHVLHRLVGDEIATEHGDRLRDVAELRVRARRARRATRVVSRGARRIGDDHDGRKLAAGGLGRDRGSHDHRLGILEPRFEACAAEKSAERRGRGQSTTDGRRLDGAGARLGQLDANAGLSSKIDQGVVKRLSGNVEAVDAAGVARCRDRSTGNGGRRLGCGWGEGQGEGQGDEERAHLEQLRTGFN